MIHIRDLTLPPGVTVKADPDAVVVQILAPIVEAEAAAAAGETAEPEVIGRPKTEEEEAE